MVNESFYEKIEHYTNKLKFISDLRSIDNLNISFDRLTKEEKVNQELLYFTLGEEEKKGIFLFSNDYFLRELKDQEFKSEFGNNLLNLLIYKYYEKIKKQEKKVKINELVNKIIFNVEKFNFVSRDDIVKRILALAYYNNWKLERCKDDIDSNYEIEVPENWGRMKQRFNLDVFYNIVNTDEYLFFLNTKGDLCLVLNEKDLFDKNDVIQALDVIKKELGLSQVNILE